MGAQQEWTPSRAPRERIDLGDLVVRRYAADDAAALDVAVRTSTEHLRPWMPWIAHEPLGVEDRRALIGQWSREWDERADFTMGIFRGEEVVGGTGLHVRSLPGCLEIGYWVHVDHVGCGVATRAVTALVDSAFELEDVERVEIRHDAANEASQNVARRAGFMFEVERDRQAQAPADVGREKVWFTTRVR